MKFAALPLPVLTLLVVFVVQGAEGDPSVPCKNAGGRCVAENSCRNIDKLNEGSCPIGKVCCKSDVVPANRGPKPPVHRGSPIPKPLPHPRPPVHAKSGRKVTTPRLPNPLQSVMCSGKCNKGKGKCKDVCSKTEKETKNSCSSPSCKCCNKTCRKEKCAAGKGTCVKKKSDCPVPTKPSKECTIPGSSKKCYCCIPGGTTSPPTTKPSTTKPPTTNPPTTKPSTTKPSTTKPSTTNPSTTKPSTTKPPTTQPPTTTAPPSG